MALTGKDVLFVWGLICSTSFHSLHDSLIQAPILAFPTDTGQYILDTDASNFGLGGVLSQIKDYVECVVANCSGTLRPSQRRYCTTKREMLATVSMCLQFRSYLRGAKFTLRTDHTSLLWLHRFNDTEGMIARWLHALLQFQFSIVHRLPVFSGQSIRVGSTDCCDSETTPGKATGSGRGTVPVLGDNLSLDLGCSAISDGAGFSTKLPPVLNCSVGSDTG